MRELVTKQAPQISKTALSIDILLKADRLVINMFENDSLETELSLT